MIGKILLVLFIIMFNTSFLGIGSENPKKKNILVLDAGHGGRDSGAIGRKAQEKNIVMAITLKVGKLVEQNLSDVEVIYTRKTDEFIPLDKRADIANKNNADLFISIHANSNKSSNPVGTETYAMGLHKTQGNFEVAQKENSVIVLEDNYQMNYEGFDPNVAESYIIFSLMQNTFLEKSLNVASYVQEDFREKAKRIDRGVKQAGFLVLWNTSMPSILVEVGFLSHPVEEEYLITESGQDILASSIYRAIKKYFSNLEMEELEMKPLDDFRNKTKNNNLVKTDTANLNLNLPITDSRDTVIFRIQVTSSAKKIDSLNTVYKEYSDVYEYQEKNTYKYTVGKSTNYNEMKSLLHQVKIKYPGAFIVAFKNNIRVDIKPLIQQ
jgi:N-acetylmuramoyl-L-alanine amidase